MPCFGGRRANKLKEISAAAAAAADDDGDDPVAFAAADATSPAPAPAPAPPSKEVLVFFGSTDEQGGELFDLEDLLRASAEVLGKGTAGTTYKATLETSGTTVVVKRLKYAKMDLPEEGEFRRRIEAIGAIQHPNIVTLRAYYYNKDEQLLVYDYLPKGSLSGRLRGSGEDLPLDWNSITGIALGVARGIGHIHSAGAVYGNFKLSNILLAGADDARISEHGITEGLFHRRAANAMGYQAPELISDDGDGTGGADPDQRSDVYGFGVLLVELLGEARSPAMEILKAEGVDLLRWVGSALPEDLAAEVIDPELLRSAGEGAEDGMLRLLQLAVECGARRPEDRPAMADVAARIEQIRRPPDRVRPYYWLSHKPDQ